MSETRLETLAIDADEAAHHLETALRELKAFRDQAEAAHESGDVYVQEMGQALQQVLSGVGMAAPFLVSVQALFGEVVTEAQEEARRQVKGDAPGAS